jgi:hypothetical protein
MRGGNALGRFDSELEVNSIWDGISRDLQRPVGQRVYWYRYDPVNTVIHPVYDVGSPQGGRAYKDPVPLPVINAYISHGQQFDNDRGFYTVDTMRLFINYEDVQRDLPDLVLNPDVYLKDRVVFRNQVYAPNNMSPRGQVGYDYMTLTVDLTQMKPEELYNDEWYSVSPTWLMGTYQGIQELGNYGDGAIAEPPA